jgi:hypothetical protein
VPPLIKPWSYDPQVVRDTVASTIAKSEAADDRAQEQAAGQPAAPPSPSAKSGATKPKKQAVMDRPATDPDANTSDLASVCSVS